MLITLIIPVYGVEQYITDCLESVMVQTNDSFECILVNDASPDASAAIAQQLIDNYQGNIQFTLVNHQKNMGLPNARNTGIKHAHGDYLAFLDSDDTISPHFIATMYDIIGQHPNTDLIQCDISTDAQCNFDTSALPAYCADNKEIRKLYLSLGIPSLVHSKLIRKQFLLSNNLFFNTTIIIHEDLYWSYYICMHAQTFAYCNQKIYHYRTCNQDSIMHASQSSFERSAIFYIQILNDFLSNTDTYNYALCRIFIINYAYYVSGRIKESKDISRDTYKSFRTLCKRLLTESIHNRNIAEAIYVMHLYQPLNRLLTWRFYRTRCLFRYERAIKYIYNATKLQPKTVC